MYLGIGIKNYKKVFWLLDFLYRKLKAKSINGEKVQVN